MEEENKPKIDNKFYIYGILGIIGVIMVVYLSTSVIPKTMVSLTKAAPASKIYLEGSYIIADKLLARADGVDKAIINVFVMDKEGRPVSGKEVTLDGPTTVVPKTDTTDNEGKTTFNVTSKTEGQTVIKALVEGSEVSNTVTVTFRN